MGDRFPKNRKIKLPEITDHFSPAPQTDSGSPALQKILVLVGPTASGKSSLAVYLAEKLPAEIISADSVQIYKYLNIGSDKPSPQTLRQVPHHLIDILDPREEYNAGCFAREAQKILLDLQKKEKIAILAGGTGLYIRALLYGLISANPVSEEVKQQVQIIYEKDGLEKCRKLLMQKDPETAMRLEPGDKQRTLRALTVYLSTGQSLSRLQKKHAFRQKNYAPLYIGLEMPKKEIHDRINLRVAEMVKQGLVQETEGILQQGYSPDLKPLQSIGYKQAVQHLNGEFDLQTMIEQIQIKTRQYAKRQITWHAKNREILRFSPQDTKPILEACRNFLKI